VATFEPHGYFYESIGPPYAHRGAAELRSSFAVCLSAGGGIGASSPKDLTTPGHRPEEES
jgi:hypothetical protein